MISLAEIDFESELSRVEAETAIERRWMDDAGVRLFETDEEIIQVREKGGLVEVQSVNPGFALRRYLREWKVEHCDPAHPRHYSPPYLRVDSYDMMLSIIDQWRGRVGDDLLLSITSLVRSRRYQSRLAERSSLAISTPGLRSSHEAGLAFDVDACGFYRRLNDRLLPFNPRVEGYDAEVARNLRVELLGSLAVFKDQINVVDEFSGTDRHCFHVAVRPQELA